MCSFPTFFTRVEFWGKKEINSTPQRPYLHLPVSSVCSIESFKDPIQIDLTFVEHIHHIILAVLSIRFEEGGFLGKAPAGEFPSCNPITSIWNKLA